MSSENRTAKSLELTYVRGLPVAKFSFVSLEKIEASMDYKAKDGDVILFAPAKTGSTWLLYILWEILHKGEPFPDVNDAYFKLIPWLEMTGREVVDALPEPRLYKQHLPFNYITKNQKAKYVFIHRKPEDVVVSYYYFNQEFSDFADMSFDEFFEAFITGKIWYGDYFDHVLSAHAHRDDENLLIVSYEALKQDTRGEILRIAKFLGEDYYKSLAEDERLIKKILEVTSFDYMKKNLKFVMDAATSTTGSVNLFRKGVVGEGKQHLTEEQSMRIKDRARQKMKGTEFIKLWQL